MVIYFPAVFETPKSYTKVQCKLVFNHETRREDLYYRSTTFFIFKKWRKKAPNIDSWINKYTLKTFIDPDTGEVTETRVRFYPIDWWTLEIDVSKIDMTAELEIENAKAREAFLQAQAVDLREELRDGGSIGLAERKVAKGVQYSRSLHPAISKINDEKKERDKKKK